MASTTALGRMLRFGAFELNVATGELRKCGLRVKLRPQAAKVLVLLASRNAETVTREQLQQEIWGSTFLVDFEHGLNLCIRQIRAALDDDSDKPRYIETIPRCGYRFIARVEEVVTPHPALAQAALAIGADAPARSGDIAEAQDAAIPPWLSQLSSRGKASFWSRRKVLSASALTLAAVVSLVFLRPRSALVPAADWVQITDFSDSVTSPAFSPDGRMLTFLRGDDTFVTAGQVYVMLLPHGNPVQLTNDSSPKMSPVFSPGGSSIDYTVPWDTWTVPVLGGQPKLRLRNASGLTWLDSDNVMFSQIINGAHMGVVSSGLSRIHVRSVYAPASSLGMAHRSYLSPDHKWVIAVEMTGNIWDRCRLVPFDGSGGGSPIGPADGVCTAAAWSPDGKWMYLNSNSGGAFHLWRQRFPKGRPEQVTSGPTEEEGIAISPDGESIVTAVGMRRSSVWLHDSHGERMVTSEATAALADPRNGSPFSVDGGKLYYVVRPSPGREVMPDRAVGQLWELDLQSGATQPIIPSLLITDFSLSPDGQQIAFTALDENSTLSIWVAPLDRSSSPRLLRMSAEHPRFTSDFIYYIKRTPGGSYAHRIRLDGSGDEQIWDENIVTLATSPDGRYLAVTLPIDEGGEWSLELVDWALKRVQPVCKDGMVYWSDDGRSLYVFAGFGKGNKNAPSYLISLRVGSDIPELPAAGLSNVAQLVALKNARTIAAHAVAAGRTPDTYAYVKETVQRDLYRIPLH
jgi:DNA-binding winged helix-turn-helix (wHTH) protein/Tol biopolymer transport system component